MLDDKEYIKWLKATVELINKYNLKDIIVKTKEMHPFDKTKDKIVSKDMLQVKVIDIHEIIVDNSTYDILDGNNGK